MIPQPSRARASREAPAAAAQLELTATARGRYRAKGREKCSAPPRHPAAAASNLIAARDVTMLKRRRIRWNDIQQVVAPLSRQTPPVAILTFIHRRK
jgi:hypothetical protein